MVNVFPHWNNYKASKKLEMQELGRGCQNKEEKGTTEKFEQSRNMAFRGHSPAILILILRGFFKKDFSTLNHSFPVLYVWIYNIDAEVYRVN